MFGFLFRLKQTEEDLSSAEDIITSHKRKIDALTQSLNSPGASTSLRHRLIAESPAPQLTSPDERSPIRKKPRLSADPNITMDLFSDFESETQHSPHKQHPQQSPSVELKKQCDVYGTKFVKITSAAKKGGKDDPTKRELNDIGNIAPAGFNFNILKKRTGFGMNSGIIKQGYNGLGSHEKFVQPSGKNVLRKNSILGRKMTSKVPSSKKDQNIRNSKAPPLPSLSGFLLEN